MNKVIPITGFLIGKREDGQLVRHGSNSRFYKQRKTRLTRNNPRLSDNMHSPTEVRMRAVPKADPRMTDPNPPQLTSEL
jgi:hypothetical protein